MKRCIPSWTTPRSTVEVSHPTPQRVEDEEGDGLVASAIDPLGSLLLAEVEARSRAQALLTSNLSKAGHAVAMNTIANLRG